MIMTRRLRLFCLRPLDPTDSSATDSQGNLCPSSHIIITLCTGLSWETGRFMTAGWAPVFLIQCWVPGSSMVLGMSQVTQLLARKFSENVLQWNWNAFGSLLPLFHDAQSLYLGHLPHLPGSPSPTILHCSSSRPPSLRNHTLQS